MANYTTERQFPERDRQIWVLSRQKAPHILSKKEIAERFGISRGRVYEIVKRETETILDQVAARGGVVGE